MTTSTHNLNEIFQITYDTLVANGCNDINAKAVANNITHAERDGSHSHGLFRLPGYVASLRSGKMNGNAQPSVEKVAPSMLRIDGDNGMAPVALEYASSHAIQCAKKQGIVAVAIVNTYHFSALRNEISMYTDNDLCAIACTAFMSSVAPAGGKKPFYGTNPLAFGWPRKDKPAMIFDMATATMAKGDVQIAARDGNKVPIGVGVDADGKDTTDPHAILNGGCLLPFGGYKGASIALMIELLIGPLIGERCSFEATQLDNKDGGPARGGELLLIIDPMKFSADPFDHAERLFQALLGIEGTRLPGSVRANYREQKGDDLVEVPTTLIEKITSLS